MADQQRWFKLWCSAPGDDALQALPPALRWAWAAFGAYTKLHGTNGVIHVRPTNSVLAAQIGVDPEALLTTLGVLPSIYLGTAPVRWPHGHEKHPVCEGEFMRGEYPLSDRGRGCLEEWCTRHGELTVTWRNWVKYQEDTTQARRGKESRSKRRGEENKNKKRSSRPLDDEFLAKLKGSPAYAGIDIDRELARMDNWLLANPDRQKTRRFVVGWLNKIDRPMAGAAPTDPYAKFPKG